MGASGVVFVRLGLRVIYELLEDAPHADDGQSPGNATCPDDGIGRRGGPQRFQYYQRSQEAGSLLFLALL